MVVFLIWTLDLSDADIKSLCESDTSTFNAFGNSIAKNVWSNAIPTRTHASECDDDVFDL